MLSRRAVFGVVAGLGGLIGLPALAREPRHVIYWSTDQVKAPVLNLDYFAQQASKDFEYRGGDLATIAYYGVRPTEHPLVVRYYWKCERTDKEGVAFDAMRDTYFRAGVKDRRHRWGDEWADKYEKRWAEDTLRSRAVVARTIWGAPV